MNSPVKRVETETVITHVAIGGDNGKTRRSLNIDKRGVGKLSGFPETNQGEP